MKLVQILESRGLSKLQLAMGSGVSPADLYQAINGKKPFFPKWRRMIAEYLHLSEEELFCDSSEVMQPKYEISDDQIEKIAKAIYQDVAKYIHEHNDEFESKLKEVKV